tara:strand:+ start:20082 stop:20327 length:246 start_codon:yes stop_codon:yes gene_type:complete
MQIDVHPQKDRKGAPWASDHGKKQEGPGSESVLSPVIKAERREVIGIGHQYRDARVATETSNYEFSIRCIGRGPEKEKACD